MRCLQAMNAARERQQAKLNEDAQKDKEERLKREEEKKRQKADEWERMQFGLSDACRTLGNGTVTSLPLLSLYSSLSLFSRYTGTHTALVHCSSTV